MSRAFVKEDGQAPPVQWRRASATVAGARTPVTLAGANRLREELQRLEAQQRPSSPTHADSAQRIALLQALLANAEVIDVGKLAGDRITFGATVVLQDVEGGASARYQIVGELEADPKLGHLSVTSPLARALIGREVGDTVQVQAPGGAREYEILELRWQ